MNLVKPVVYYLGSTRNSISVRWDPACSSSTSSTTLPAYVVQVEDDSNGWETKYWGIKNSAVLKGLGPEKLYNVRVGVCANLGEDTWSDETWSDIYTFSTKPGLLWTFYLFQFVEKGDAAKIKRFLKERNDCLDTYNRYGETPLLVAIRQKNDSVLRILLEAGADVYQLAKATCKTPLMVACYSGYRAAVEALCAIGVDWSVVDRNGCQAIHYAVDGGQTDIVNLAIEKGADVNARDKFGWTPLMRAVLTGADEVLIKLLVENGADTSLRDVNKMTALELAELMRDDRLTEILRLHLKTTRGNDVTSGVEDDAMVDVPAVDESSVETTSGRGSSNLLPGSEKMAKSHSSDKAKSSDAFGDLNDRVGDDDDEDNNAIKALVNELAQIALVDANKSN